MVSLKLSSFLDDFSKIYPRKIPTVTTKTWRVHLNIVNRVDGLETHLNNNMLELNTEKEGCMSYTTPEDAQRPRAVYDIHPDFRGI